MIRHMTLDILGYFFLFTHFKRHLKPSIILNNWPKETGKMLGHITNKSNIKTLELSSMKFELKVHTYLKCVQVRRQNPNNRICRLCYVL